MDKHFRPPRCPHESPGMNDPSADIPPAPLRNVPNTGNMYFSKKGIQEWISVS